MDPTNVPFELISYRGFLKSLDGIKKGIFSTNESEAQPESGEEKISRNSNKSFFSNLTKAMNFLEGFLFMMMNMYDNYVYSPLQKTLSPIVRIVPRYLNFGQNIKIPIFTANIVTLARTFLVIPIAWFLKYDYNMMAFLCVVFHDFLDHLDGIVAKVQKLTYPNHDDPILGGFLDAFCDKIVNVLSIWTILLATNFDLMSQNQTLVYLAVCYGVIAYETILGVVRVQDYFLAKFKKDFKIDGKKSKDLSESNSKSVTAASMEGKLKEKLESTGIAFLCLAVSKNSSSPISSNSGLAGMICLILTLRMAHKSLAVKIRARSEMKNKSAKMSKKNSTSAENLLEMINNSNQTVHPDFENAEMKMVDITNNNITEQSTMYHYQKRKNLYLEDQNINLKRELEKIEKKTASDKIQKQHSSVKVRVDNRVDKVYTIGCFDLFHFGHVELINRMRELGKKVIIGVHDSRSIYKLKKRVPVDSTEKRMMNVKTVADEVFCIAGCDPSNFMSCIVNLGKNETALYVRGDDMPDFPSREVVESLMPIKLLPYTEGVSTTKLRKEKYSHIAPDDEEYLDKIN